MKVEVAVVVEAEEEIEIVEEEVDTLVEVKVQGKG